MKATQFNLKLGLAVALSLATFAFNSLPGRSRPSLLVSQRLPEVDPREPGPPPDNQREPGGGLNPHKPSCGHNNKSLAAIVPLKNWVLTASETPSFWFYVPDRSADVVSGEFLLLTRDGKQRLHAIHFTLPEEAPGIVSITLPYSLELGDFEEGTYYWQVSLNCRDKEGSEPDPLVYGWVKRVEEIAAPQGQATETEPNLSYDDITNLASQLQQNSPDRSEIEKEWRNLLESIELEELFEKKIVGEVEYEEVGWGAFYFFDFNPVIAVARSIRTRE